MSKENPMLKKLSDFMFKNRNIPKGCGIGLLLFFLSILAFSIYVMSVSEIDLPRVPEAIIDFLRLILYVHDNPETEMEVEMIVESV